jgi:hypothetical protein
MNNDWISLPIKAMLWAVITNACTFLFTYLVQEGRVRKLKKKLKELQEQQDAARVALVVWCRDDITLSVEQYLQQRSCKQNTQDNSSLQETANTQNGHSDYPQQENLPELSPQPTNSQGPESLPPDTQPNQSQPTSAVNKCQHNIKVFTVGHKGPLSNNIGDWHKFLERVKDVVQDMRKEAPSQILLFTNVPVAFGVLLGGILDNGPAVEIHHYFNGVYAPVAYLTHETCKV